MGAIAQEFPVGESDGEYSIEIDPRKVSDATVALLAELGFNRISLGVQDFDPECKTRSTASRARRKRCAVIDAARANGFQVDQRRPDLRAAAGKRWQASRRTLDQVIEATPDRIALYSYAHVPHLFKPQRRISEDDLPAPDTKLDILTLAIGKLTDRPVTSISAWITLRSPMTNSPWRSARARLHRNFQGYSTHADCDLLSRRHFSHRQDGHDLQPEFPRDGTVLRCAGQHDLPIMRGMELDADDLVRRAIIQAFTERHFDISKESFNISHLIDFDVYFATELKELAEYEKEGLLSLSAMDQRYAQRPHVDTQHLYGL